jgi:riboflavin kinase/FMN adenylyltransferase
MRIVRNTRAEGDDRGASAAIGNFDGVHRGHQAVIAQARRDDAPLGVVTFEPHPRQYFAPKSGPFRLMTPAAKLSRLEKLGVSVVYELPFDQIAPLPAKVFAQEIIVQGLGLKHVTVGTDFHFGKGRDGNADTLVGLGASLGFGVTVAELVQFDGEISSTRIRTALSEGDAREAARLLGHLHRIEGEVLHGDKRGRDLGYPTANLSLEGLHPPRFGVYAAEVDILTGPYCGSASAVASVGVRPTFEGAEPRLEAHLFDFSGDLYGERLSVALVEFLRPEEKFTNLPELVTQMHADSARAREILAA